MKGLLKVMSGIAMLAALIYFCVGIWTLKNIVPDAVGAGKAEWDFQQLIKQNDLESLDIKPKDVMYLYDYNRTHYKIEKLPYDTYKLDVELPEGSISSEDTNFPIGNIEVVFIPKDILADEEKKIKIVGVSGTGSCLNGGIHFSELVDGVRVGEIVDATPNAKNQLSPDTGYLYYNLDGGHMVFHVENLDRYGAICVNPCYGAVFLSENKLKAGIHQYIPLKH